jgi:hypothetical protein
MAVGRKMQKIITYLSDYGVSYSTDTIKGSQKI